MYGDRDRIVKLRVTTDELTKWTAAAKKRDAGSRNERAWWPGMYRRAEGLSGFIRAAVETAIKNGHVGGRGHKARAAAPGARRRRGHKTGSRKRRRAR